MRTDDIFTDKDADLGKLDGKTVAILGYGSQGHAHALNLKDSGVDVVVGLRPDSSSRAKAEAAGLEVLDIAEAASRGDLVMILLPDEKQAEVWREQIADGIAPGNLLLFAHGFAIHFGEIEPPPGVDVGMVAPKGPGHLVRRQYEEGSGVPCLMAVHQDATGEAHDLVLAYASGIGGGRAAVIETTFKDECETDLFGEQAVLCGGASELVRAGYETLVEAGYDPRLAYFECLHELKLIADLMYEKGIQGMRYSISNTAEYGDMTRGKRVIGEESRAAMKEILSEIQSGDFAKEFIAENRAGNENFDRMRAEGADHQIEDIGHDLRDMMPWIDQGFKDTKLAVVGLGFRWGWLGAPPPGGSLFRCRPGALARLQAEYPVTPTEPPPTIACVEMRRSGAGSFSMSRIDPSAASSRGGSGGGPAQRQGLDVLLFESC